MSLEALLGERVSLRQLRADDPGTIDMWYSDAANLAREARSLDQILDGAVGDEAGLLAIVRPEDGEAIGLIESSAADGRLAVAFIALAKAYRGWGYGSEAVRLLEEWAVQERLAHQFWAEVPVKNGLGLYFWLRLGYRPEGPQDARGWRMERERDRMRMVRYANR